MPLLTKNDDSDLRNTDSIYDQNVDKPLSRGDKKAENEAAKNIVDGEDARLNPSKEHLDNTIAQMEKQFSDSPKEYSPIKNTLAKARGWIKKNPKKSGGLGMGILGIGVAGYLGIIASGPLQIIHFANMLQNFHFSQMDTVSANRLRNLINYSKWAQGKAGLENTRLGNIEAHKAKKIDTKLAKSGMSSAYNPATGKFLGYDIEVDNLPEDLKNKLNKTNDLDQKRKILANQFNIPVENIPIPEGVDGKSFRINVDNPGQARRLTQQVLNLSPEFNKATAALAKRILTKRANINFNPFTRATESVKTKFAENRERRLQNKAEKPNIKSFPNYEASPESSDAVRENANILENSNKEAEQIARDIVDNPGQDPEVTKSKLVNIIKAGSGPLIIVSLGCMTKDLAGAATDLQKTNKIGTSIKIASEILTVGSKIMDGKDIDLEAVGEINYNLNSEDSSWISASTIQAEQGTLDPKSEKTLSSRPELDPSQNSSYSAEVDSLMNNVLVTGFGFDLACKIISFVDDQISNIASFVTRGFSELIEEQTIGRLVNLFVAILSGGEINIASLRGATYGEMGNLGGRLMANESALSMGGSFLPDQVAYENKEYIAKYEEKSFSEKYLDIYNPQSVAGNLAFKASSDKSANNIASIPANILTQIGSIFSKGAYASSMVSSEQYYGIPVAGFGLAKLDTIDNPYQNAIEVRQILTSNPGLITEFEDCTGVKIEMSETDLNFVSKSNDEGIVGQYVGNEDMIKKCGEDANPDLYKVRVLALDTTLLKSFSCLEFEDEQSCIDIMGSSYSSGQDSASNGGSISRPTSSKAEQIQAILANPKIKWGNFGSADSQKNDVQYFLTNNAVTGLLVMAEQSGVDIPLNSLLRIAESGSDHSVGRAIDVGYYGNGQPQHSADGDKLYNFLYDNYKELRISQLIWQEPPSGKKCIGNNGNSVSEVDCYEYYGKQTMDGHYHHIHIGFLPDNAEVSL